MSEKTRPSLVAVLADLGREQLQALLVRLAELQPALADVIESQVALISAPVTPARNLPGQARPKRRTAIDPAPIRRQVRSAFRGQGRMSYYDDYGQASGIVNEVQRILEQAWVLIRDDDGGAALPILEAISAEYLEGYEELDDSDGDAGDFFSELGEAWAEALLTADLTDTERGAWSEKLGAWCKQAGDYGVEGGFAIALDALAHGWDSSSLQAVLQGQDPEAAGWTQEDWDASHSLMDARLNILDRQARYDEYLNLARAGHKAERYASMLVRLERVQEAVEYGLGHLESVYDAELLAQHLFEQNAIEAALDVAAHGLTLEGPKASLAVWLRDTAATAGQPERALTAAVIAFQENPDLVAYLRAQELAGDAWPEHRATLLDHLRKPHWYHPRGEIEVFLHEGLVEDAIAVVDKSTHGQIVEAVADAAVYSHPEWVIETCRQRAETIMDEGRSGVYQEAARWLAKARTAYHALGREAEWRAYLEELIALHQRKYKLRPLLEALRR